MRLTLLFGLVPMSLWLLVALCQVDFGLASSSKYESDLSEDEDERPYFAETLTHYTPTELLRTPVATRGGSLRNQEQKLLKKIEKMKRKLRELERKLLRLREEMGGGEPGPKPPGPGPKPPGPGPDPKPPGPDPDTNPGTRPGPSPSPTPGTKPGVGPDEGGDDTGGGTGPPPVRRRGSNRYGQMSTKFVSDLNYNGGWKSARKGWKHYY